MAFTCISKCDLPAKWHTCCNWKEQDFSHLKDKWGFTTKKRMNSESCTDLCILAANNTHTKVEYLKQLFIIWDCLIDIFAQVGHWKQSWSNRVLLTTLYFYWQQKRSNKPDMCLHQLTSSFNKITQSCVDPSFDTDHIDGEWGDMSC